MMDDILLVACAALVVWLGWQHPAHADTNAEKVFGRWERVAIEDIRRPVPEWQYQQSSLGSVTAEYRRRSPEKDRPAEPGGPKIFPRSTAPEQVAGLYSNSLERR